MSGAASIDELLPFKVEEWDADEQHVVEILARATNVLIARAAFTKAVEMRGTRRILLRNGGHVVARHEPKTNKSLT